VYSTHSLTPRHYNPCRVLAESRKRLHTSLSLALVLPVPESQPLRILRRPIHPSQAWSSYLSSALRLVQGDFFFRTFQVPILRHFQGHFRLGFSFLPRLISWIFATRVFTGAGRQPAAKPPTWRARVSLLVWAITFDLSGKEDPTSS
jgi:hypothetical protein